MDRAEHLAPAEAAAEAVKAFLRIHRSRLGDDPELLALVVPSRYPGESKVTDYQRYALDKLLAENAALKAERDGLKSVSDKGAVLRERVRRLVLDLISAGSLTEVVATAVGAATALGAEAAVLGIEAGASYQLRDGGIVTLSPGLVDSLVERDAVGALLRGMSHPALFPDRPELVSTAIFRLRIGPKTPPALFAVASSGASRFDDDGETREIAYFARALERTIGAWLARSRN